MISKISTIIKNHLIQSCHVIYCRTKINIYISISLSKPNLFDRNDDSNPMTIHNFCRFRSIGQRRNGTNGRFFVTGCVRSCVSIVVFSVILILFRIETGCDLFCVDEIIVLLVVLCYFTLELRQSRRALNAIIWPVCVSFFVFAMLWIFQCRGRDRDVSRLVIQVQ